MGSVYLTEVRELGAEVPDFMEAGLLILFQTGAPPELAEISVLHEVIEFREEPPKPGDVLHVGHLEFRITAVGSKAWENVLALGHAVLKFDGSEVAELPGEIRLEHEGFEGLAELVKPGTRIEIRDETEKEALDVA